MKSFIEKNVFRFSQNIWKITRKNVKKDVIEISNNRNELKPLKILLKEFFQYRCMFIG